MRIRPTDAINLGALVVLAVMTGLLRERLVHPGELLLRLGVLALVVLGVAALARREDRLPTAAQLFVEFYPAIYLPFVFNTLEPLIEAIHDGARDDVLIAADRWIFGVDVTVWMQRLVRPHLSDLFFFFYATYYLFALTLGLILWSRDHETARRLVFTLMLCYYVSYAGYFTIPALGPRFAQAADYTVSLTTTTISRFIEGTINSLETTKFDVFPSGHTMIAVAVLIVARKRAPDVFRYFLFFGTGLVISTVYCRYHYVIDVIAGMTLAFVTVPIGDWVYDRMVGARELAVGSRASAL